MAINRIGTRDSETEYRGKAPPVTDPGTKPTIFKPSPVIIVSPSDEDRPVITEEEDEDEFRIDVHPDGTIEIPPDDMLVDEEEDITPPGGDVLLPEKPMLPPGFIAPGEQPPARIPEDSMAPSGIPWKLIGIGAIAYFLLFKK